MKFWLLIFLLLFIPPSLAEEKKRFVEFVEPPAKTRSYDLSTVKIIQPGRFTIESKSIDDPDVMTLELQALGALVTFCKRPDGSYPPPTAVFTLGTPDLPIKNIEVKSSTNKEGKQFKQAAWSYPYKRLAFEEGGKFLQDELSFFCKDGLQRDVDEGTLRLEQVRSITNGANHKELFDCKRNIAGEFTTLDHFPEQTERFWPSDPDMVNMFPVTRHSYRDLWYQELCSRVMQEKPYSPE